MDEKIKECHNLLNDVYDNCERIYGIVCKKYKEAKMESYKGYYIRIDGEYEYQKYYMPVISIGGLGDICFNFDGISLEFFIDKIDLINGCDFTALSKTDFDVEIYDAADSTIDIYEKGMSQDCLIDKLKRWRSDLIGITVNCQGEADEDVLKIFEHVSTILGILK